MEYCPHCLKETQGIYCEHCGGVIRWEAAQGQLPVGTILQGAGENRYQIGAAKGQGGFGITYAAMSLQNGRRVAIKEYYPTHCANRNPTNQVIPLTGHTEEYQKGIHCFLDEAMMLSAVGALPSVVTVTEYFEANGTAYLVMEYVDGQPLHEVISQKGRFDAKELLPMLPALLRDLGVLHNAGIIHRDISPDNLILMPEGKLKLIDFGSARSLNASKNMTVLLKPGFSPVEQYQSTGQGPYTDLYALASTIYHCLTGTVPPASFDRMANDTLQRPNALGAGLTAEQEDALMWALSVRPEDRPSSAALFAERLFPPASVQSTSSSVFVPSTPAKKKPPVVLLVGLAASVLLNVVLAIFALVNFSDSQNYETKYKDTLVQNNSLQSQMSRLEQQNQQLQSENAQLKDQNESLKSQTNQSQESNVSAMITDSLLGFLESCTGVEANNLNYNLVRAAETRAEENSDGFLNTRPNGDSYGTVLDDYKISWRACIEVRNTFNYTDFDSLYDELADSIAEYCIFDVDGMEYQADSMGIGMYSNGETITVIILLVAT